MEILEIISYHQNENITEVVFRLVNDDVDTVRTDVIENTYFDEFGYEYLSPASDYTFEEDDFFINEEFSEYLDEDDLVAFLNEYYIVYPDKLPDSEFE